MVLCVISNMTFWAIRTGPGCACMCVPWWNVATLAPTQIFNNMCKYTQKPNNKTCELGYGWHAQVGCMGKDISPPLKIVGLWLTSWVPQWLHIPWSLGATTPMSFWHNPMSEQCSTRLYLARGLHYRLHSWLGTMLTSGTVCPCGQHLRRPCGPQVTACCDTFCFNNPIPLWHYNQQFNCENVL